MATAINNLAASFSQQPWLNKIKNLHMPQPVSVKRSFSLLTAAKSYFKNEA